MDPHEPPAPTPRPVSPRPRARPTAEDLKHARIEGSWPVTLTVTSTTGFRDLTGGTTKTRTYTFTGGARWRGHAHRRRPPTASVTIPLTYADGTYTGDGPDLGVQNCVLDNGTVAVANGIRNSQTVTLTVSSAVPDAGLWRATGLAGTVLETATQIAGAAGQCRTGSATFGLASSR